MRVHDLPTPCAVVDLDVLERNARRMAARVTELGGRLRPHVKTHKCAEIARLQVEGHFGGITVSTLAEARHFAAAGFRDVTWALPIAPSRLDDAAAVARSLEALQVLVDHPEAVDALEAHGRARGTRFRVLLKVDCGTHRAGVDPSDPASVALALRLAGSRHLDFRGVLVHAGHSYACRTREEARVVARSERETAVRFAESLRAHGVAVAEVSLGSTPTLAAAESLEGTTEARPGNYVFHDAFQAAIGSCALEDIAFAVLASVIGRYPSRREVLVDAGALSLSKDEGARHADPGCGFGRLASAETGAPLPGLVVDRLSQEHGILRAEPSFDLDRLRIGTKLRILPNHSCLSAAMHDRYVVARGDDVVAEWRPARGW